MNFTEIHPLLAAPGKKLFPVVHVLDLEQANRNVDIAMNNGADGIFLINHDYGPTHLIETYKEVRDSHPDIFIGLNLLGLGANYAFKLVSDLDAVSALWVDNPGITDEGYTADALRLESDMRHSDWPGAYFASVAFKHQAIVRNTAAAANNASSMCHVIVTSGASTGSAPLARKLALMKRGVMPHTLFANASGTDLENVTDFAQHADVFLVASGINMDNDFYNLDPLRVETMAHALHTFK